MDLENINISPKSLNARINRIKDMLPRQSNSVHHIALILAAGRNRRELALIINTVEALGHDHDAVARYVVFLQRLADDFFGAAVRVHICCIPGVDSALVGVLDQREGFVFV